MRTRSCSAAEQLRGAQQHLLLNPVHPALQAALEGQLAKQSLHADGRIVKAIKQCEAFLNARQARPAALAELKQRVATTLAAVQPAERGAAAAGRLSSNRSVSGAGSAQLQASAQDDCASVASAVRPSTYAVTLGAHKYVDACKLAAHHG